MMMILKNARFPVYSFLTLAGLLCFQRAAFTQAPVITVRLANPQNDCITQEYCLDVEARADIPDQEIFGMNIRFFYDDDVLELVDFRDFQGGYGPIAPNPPVISTSGPAGPSLFNFSGPAEFVNGAMQLVSSGPPPIILDTSTWSKLFQICFLVDDQNANLDTFCPSVVWDLEQNPLNGGFLSGDDGVVLTIVDPDPNNESLPADENVVQFNWEYIGNGSPPYGQPFDSVCSNINCALPLTLLFFRGEAREEGNILQWQTNEEINVAGFNLQRSADGVTWSTIDYRKSTGDDGGINRYECLDMHPVRGGSFYRLQMLDRDGRFSYSGLISVFNSLQLKQQDLMVYPNPAKAGIVFISLLSPPQPGAIVNVFDAAGQEVMQKSINYSGMELDVSKLPAGVYFLRVKSGIEYFMKSFIVE